jgi:hypothetical protein
MRLVRACLLGVLSSAGESAGAAIPGSPHALDVNSQPGLYDAAMGIGNVTAAAAALPKQVTTSAGSTWKPVNALDVPVRVISLASQPRSEIEPNLERFRQVGFRNVEPFIGFDTQGSDADSMLKDGLITYSAWSALVRGKRSYYEFGGVGAVGCARSHLAACSETEDVIVAEDDAVPRDFLAQQVAAVLATRDPYDGEPPDLTIFGPLVIHNSSRVYPLFPDTPWEELSEITAAPTLEPLNGRAWWGMHTLLWTARGCRRVRALLGGKPSDVQIDDELSMMASLLGKGALNVYLQTGVRAATQCYGTECKVERQSETGNNKECRLCTFAPEGSPLIERSALGKYRSLKHPQGPGGRFST